MKKNNIIFKSIFSLTFIVIAILITCFEWAKVNINNTVIILVCISFLPWIINYIKSLEVFGMKLELLSDRKKEEIEKNILEITSQENINMVAKEDNKDYQNKNTILLESTWKIFLEDDKIIKLVLTRVELEKLIKQFCQKLKLNTNGTIKSMALELYNHKIIGASEYKLINDMIPILNKAIHSDIKSLNEEDIDWTIDSGISLLSLLEYTYKTQKKYN